MASAKTITACQQLQFLWCSVTWRLSIKIGYILLKNIKLQQEDPHWAWGQSCLVTTKGMCYHSDQTGESYWFPSGFKSYENSLLLDAEFIEQEFTPGNLPKTTGSHHKGSKHFTVFTVGDCIRAAGNRSQVLVLHFDAHLLATASFSHAVM